MALSFRNTVDPLARYRIVGAMLELGEFTYADVMKRARVDSVDTVRTIVHRNPDLVETIGQVATGQRGGQPQRFRLRDEAAAGLRAELRETFARFSDLAALVGAADAATPARAAAADRFAAPPLALEVAESTLRRLAKPADSPGEPLDAADVVAAARSALAAALTATEVAARTGVGAAGLRDHRKQEILERLENIDRDLAAGRFDVAGVLQRLEQVRADWNKPLAAPAAALKQRVADAYAVLAGTAAASARAARDVAGTATEAFSRVVVFDATPEPDMAFGCQVAAKLEEGMAAAATMVPVTGVAALGAAIAAGQSLINKQTTVIVTVDSSATVATAQSIADAAAKLTNCRAAFVFDRGFDAGVRNVAYSHNLIYEGQAASLDSDGMTSMISNLTLGAKSPY